MESILQTLLEITVYSAVLFAGILLLKGLCGKKMSPVLHDALWLLLLLRLVIPVTVDSGFSLFTLPESAAPVVAAGGETIGNLPILRPQEQAGGGAAVADEPVRPFANAAREGAQGAGTRLTWTQILFCAWLAGAAGCLAWLGVLYVTLRRRIRKNAALPSKKLLMLLEEVKRELGVYRNIHLLCLYEYGTPALLFPNTVLMPVDALAAMDAAEIKLALRHELTHFKRGDQFRNVLLSLLNAIYWFNPIVWIAFRLMRSDMETACDSMVTRRLSRTEKNEYANLILSLFSRPAHRQIVLGMAGISTRKVAEQRIRGIYMRKSSKPAVKIVSIAAALILLVGCFTTACVPKRAQDAAQTVIGGADATAALEDAAAAVNGDYGVVTAIDGDTVTASAAQGGTYLFTVNELPPMEGSLEKSDGCISAAEAVQRAVPLMIALFPEMESPCSVGVQYSRTENGAGRVMQGYALYFDGTDYETARYNTGISSLNDGQGGAMYAEALFPGEPEAVTGGLDFDWDANYQEEYATRALEQAKELIQNRIAPGGEILEDSFIDGIQVAFGSPDLFALDAKIHMREGASYVVQYLMPSGRISRFEAYPLGWHSAMWGYTDPAEEKAYPSLDGSYTWDDANAYTEAQNVPPEGQADVAVTEEMYEAIARAAEGMIGTSFPFEAPNVDETVLPGIYEYTFIRMVQNAGYPAEAISQTSQAGPVDDLNDALLRRGRLIMRTNEDGTKSQQGIWLGEDCYAYADYETGLVEKGTLTVQDFAGENRVRIEMETTLRVPVADAIAPTPTPGIS